MDITHLRFFFFSVFNKDRDIQSDKWSRLLTPAHTSLPISLSLHVSVSPHLCNSEECDWHWRCISNCHGVNAFKNMRSGCDRWALPFPFAITKNTHAHIHTLTQNSSRGIINSHYETERRHLASQSSRKEDGLKCFMHHQMYNIGQFCVSNPHLLKTCGPPLHKHLRRQEVDSLLKWTFMHESANMAL